MVPTTCLWGRVASTLVEVLVVVPVAAVEEGGIDPEEVLWGGTGPTPVVIPRGPTIGCVRTSLAVISLRVLGSPSSIPMIPRQQLLLIHIAREDVIVSAQRPTQANPGSTAVPQSRPAQHARLREVRSD